jgi:hypothetical protein
MFVRSDLGALRLYPNLPIEAALAANGKDQAGGRTEKGKQIIRIVFFDIRRTLRRLDRSFPRQKLRTRQ